MFQKQKLKVCMALSGGVDSAVSAALLKEAGHEVTGVFIKVWQPPTEWGIPCTAEEDRLEAMRVAAHLNIPFETFDSGDTYKEEVVDIMISEYKAGRTPNPDVLCNRSIKFGALRSWADSHDFDVIATGHYAQIKQSAEGAYELHAGVDPAKDQSYFLWMLTSTNLARTLFPVGGLEKTEVRALAEKFGLPNSKRKDSQGLCFIGKLDIKDFLSKFISIEQGNVLDESGHVIGTHDGAAFYTEGERRGFTVSAQSPSETPYYIVAKDVKNNTLTVSHAPKESSLTPHTSLTLTDPNWHFTPESGKKYGARLRYRQPLQECGVEENKVTFSEPQTVIPRGQSLVIYDGSKVIGGGIIE